jgi:hypothetical protein
VDAIQQLFKLLRETRSKDSPEVKTFLATIKEIKPDIYATLASIADNWQAPKDAPSFTDRLPDRNTLLGGGVSIVALASTPMISTFVKSLETDHPLTKVTSPMVLLLIVAALGALAGAAYSIYSHRGVIFPEFGKKEGVLTLTQYGILNEIFLGAVAAVTTIWFAAVGIAIPGESATAAADSTTATASADANKPVNADPAANAGQEEATKKAAAQKSATNLLSYSMIFGSLISGWFGARMRALRLGQGLLQEALADTAITEKMSPEMADKIRAAPTASVAASLATGMRVVGANVPESITAAAAATIDGTAAPAAVAAGPNVVQNPVVDGRPASEVRLFNLLDPSKVRVSAVTLGPLSRDSVWLTLNALQSFDVADPMVRQLLGDLKIKDVASMSIEDFLAQAKATHLDTTKLEPILLAIQATAKAAAAVLDQQPTNWSWPV